MIKIKVNNTDIENLTKEVNYRGVKVSNSKTREKIERYYQ